VTSAAIPPSFDAWIRELSLAAGEDMKPVLKHYGTTVGELNLPETREGLIREQRSLLANSKSSSPPDSLESGNRS
jgi:hypothetical protein